MVAFAIRSASATLPKPWPSAVHILDHLLRTPNAYAGDVIRASSGDLLLEYTFHR